MDRLDPINKHDKIRLYNRPELVSATHQPFTDIVPVILSQAPSTRTPSIPPSRIDVVTSVSENVSLAHENNVRGHTRKCRLEYAAIPAWRYLARREIRDGNARLSNDRRVAEEVPTPFSRVAMFGHEHSVTPQQKLLSSVL